MVDQDPVSHAAILKYMELSTCPHNMTLVAVGNQIAGWLDEQGSAQYGMQILQLDKMGDRRALFVGIFLNGLFVPMFMVMASEYIERMGVYCGGDNCTHLECQLIVDTNADPSTLEATEAAFAPMAKQLGDELPSFEGLAKYYLLDRDQDTEGGG